MQKIQIDQKLPTHVVARAGLCLTFNSGTDFAEVAGQINSGFGFTPLSLSDLANLWTARRPDLLIGAFSPDPSTLTVLGDGVALDPHCSTLLRKAVRLLGIQSVRRILLHGLEYDVWTTDVGALRGKIPSLLFHGTSSSNLDSILRQGLRTDRRSNWTVGGRDHVYLTATPQTAAFHARRTASHQASEPVVIACRRPWRLHPDWDVIHQLSENPDVPSRDSCKLTKEAGLFASRKSVSRIALIAAYKPVISAPIDHWPVCYQATRLRRLLSWIVR